MSVLVFLEHHGSELQRGSLGVLSKAASLGHGEVAAVLVGGGVKAFASEAGTFGAGKVAVWGDSSAIDDGTGQPGNNLFNGWNDPAGTDAALALNATAWLAGAGGGGGGGGCTPGQLLGNPGFESGNTVWSASSGVIDSSSAIWPYTPFRSDS